MKDKIDLILQCFPYWCEGPNAGAGLSGEVGHTASRHGNGATRIVLANGRVRNVHETTNVGIGGSGGGDEGGGSELHGHNVRLNIADEHVCDRGAHEHGRHGPRICQSRMRAFELPVGGCEERWWPESETAAVVKSRNHRIGCRRMTRRRR